MTPAGGSESLGVGHEIHVLSLSLAVFLFPDLLRLDEQMPIASSYHTFPALAKSQNLVSIGCFF